MYTSEIISVVLVFIAAIGVVAFLIWKNNKDKKLLNPDAEASVEETEMDIESRRDNN